jgi:hypothetical protein
LVPGIKSLRITDRSGANEKSSINPIVFAERSGRGSEIRVRKRK